MRRPGRRPRSAVDAARPRVHRRGLPQSVPPDHAHEAARAERRRRAALEDLDGHTAGLVALAGRAALERRGTASAGCSIALVGMFGRAPRLHRAAAASAPRRGGRQSSRCSDLAAAFRVPIVATNGVRFADAEPSGRCYDVLTCIHHKTDARARPAAGWRRNAERYLKPPEQMAALFADLPAGAGRHARRWPTGSSSRWPISATAFPTIRCRPARRRRRFCGRSPRSARASGTGRITIARARRSRASSISSRSSISPATSSSSGTSSTSAGSSDILVQGRGSAANSAVCYSLGITAVDPVGMDLLFERFLSEERGEWPDIDLDLPSGDRRERVIQHVYERYGTLGAGDDRQRDHVPRPQRGARSGEGARARRARRSIGSRR